MSPIVWKRNEVRFVERKLGFFGEFAREKCRRKTIQRKAYIQPLDGQPDHEVGDEIH